MGQSGQAHACRGKACVYVCVCVGVGGGGGGGGGGQIVMVCGDCCPPGYFTNILLRVD